eukprot:5058981-Ditylum_brightwellii.AAC.1
MDLRLRNHLPISHWFTCILEKKLAILLLVNLSLDPICHRNGLTEGGCILHGQYIINLAALIKAVIKNIDDGYVLKSIDAILYFVEQPFGHSHLKLIFGHSLAHL